MCSVHKVWVHVICGKIWYFCVDLLNPFDRVKTKSEDPTKAKGSREVSTVMGSSHPRPRSPKGLRPPQQGSRQPSLE